jgi:hypothetical protein
MLMSAPRGRVYIVADCNYITVTATCNQYKFNFEHSNITAFFERPKTMFKNLIF